MRSWEIGEMEWNCTYISMKTCGMPLNLCCVSGANLSTSVLPQGANCAIQKPDCIPKDIRSFKTSSQTSINAYGVRSSSRKPMQRLSDVFLELHCLHRYIGYCKSNRLLSFQNTKIHAH